MHRGYILVARFDSNMNVKYQYRDMLLHVLQNEV
jgi:hypothetical protein